MIPYKINDSLAIKIISCPLRIDSWFFLGVWIDPGLNETNVRSDYWIIPGFVKVAMPADLQKPRSLVIGLEALHRRLLVFGPHLPWSTFISQLQAFNFFSLSPTSLVSFRTLKNCPIWTRSLYPAWMVLSQPIPSWLGKCRARKQSLLDCMDALAAWMVGQGSRVGYWRGQVGGRWAIRASHIMRRSHPWHLYDRCSSWIGGSEERNVKRNICNKIQIRS